MSATKSALDKLIDSTSSHWPTLTPKARAELAQLRADLQAAQERIKNQREPLTNCETVMCEQARQLNEANELIRVINQRVYLKRDLQVEVNHWLAANPAPHVHLSSSGKCVICGLPDPSAEPQPPNGGGRP